MRSDLETRIRALEDQGKKNSAAIQQAKEQDRLLRSTALAGGASGGGSTSPATADAALVRITSTTPDANGHLPAQIRLYNPSTGLYDWKECRVLQT